VDPPVASVPALSKSRCADSTRRLDLSELVRDRVWEFADVFVPVPLKGATGSPGSPIAVR